MKTLPIALLCAALPVTPSLAQSPSCAPRAEVVAALAQQFGEARTAMAMAGSAHVMELFVNPARGTWTMIATRPDGQACLIASGSQYEAVADSLPALGDPA